MEREKTKQEEGEKFLIPPSGIKQRRCGVAHLDRNINYNYPPFIYKFEEQEEKQKNKFKEDDPLD